jgi:hypothetical protein
MATGSLDANGIWIYGEDDSEATFSALLNKLGDSTSDQIGPLKAAGRIVQVKQVFKADVFSSTSSSYVDITGLSVSITPTSSTNKILVFASAPIGVATTGTAFVKLLRNSTDLSTFGYGDAAYIYLATPTNIAYLDSPATTSSVTYKIQGRNTAGTTWRINSRGADTGYLAASAITVMEIVA